jgi:hypothetical protein
MNLAPLWLRWRVWVVVVVAVVALLAMRQCDRSAKARGDAVYQERLRVLALERDSIKNVSARRDTLYQTDTIVRTKAVTKYERLRDSVLVRLTDTVLVKETLIAADTSNAKSLAALRTAEARIADRDRLILNERTTRATSDSLHRVQMARANPRLLPYVEAFADLNHSRTYIGRAGLELRLLGPVRLGGAVEGTTMPNHTDARALVGLRVTF